MPSKHRGLIRATLLLLWALVVLAFFLVEHPAVLTINPYANFKPVPGGGDPGQVGAELRGLLGAAGLVLWAGLAGRSALRKRRRAAAPAADGPAEGTPAPGDGALSATVDIAFGFLLLEVLAMALGFTWLLRGALPIVLAGSFLLLAADNRDLARIPRVPRLPRSWDERTLLALVTISLAAGLVIHLSPVVATDAHVYHLRIAKAYAEAGGILRLPYNVYANMPHATELLYTVAYVVGGESGAALLDFAFRAILLVGLAAFARRYLGAAKPLLPAAFFLMTPLVLDNRTVANIDVAMAFTFLAALVAVFRWVDSGKLGQILLASALIGLLAGMKYTGILYGGVLFLAAIFLAVTWKTRPVPLLQVLILPIPAILVFAPWLVKAAVMTGNPFYPLAPEQFGGIEWNAEMGDRLLVWQKGMGMGRQLADHLALPWNMTVRGNLGYPAFDGILSPLYLMWIPAVALAVPIPAAIWTLVATSALSLVVWAWGPQQLRFFMPALGPLALVSAWAVDRTRVGPDGRPTGGFVRLFGRTAMVFTILYGVLFTWNLARSTFPNQLPVVLGAERRADYLDRRLQCYEPMMRANRELPRGAKLLLVWENRGYLLDRPYIADSFYEASWIMQLLEKDMTGEALAARLRDEKVTHVLLNAELGKFFGRSYNPRVREAMDRFIRERGKPLFDDNGIFVVELAEKGAAAKETKKPAKPRPATQ